MEEVHLAWGEGQARRATRAWSELCACPPYLANGDVPEPVANREELHAWLSRTGQAMGIPVNPNHAYFISFDILGKKLLDTIEQVIASRGVALGLAAYLEWCEVAQEQARRRSLRDCRREKFLEFQWRRDQVFRRHLLALSEQGRSEAMCAAQMLRDAGSEWDRTFLSAVFLEPAWIDSDLQEVLAMRRAGGVETGPAFIPPLSLLHAHDLQCVGAFLSGLSDLEALQLFGHAPRLCHAFMDQHREKGIAPLVAGLRRLHDLWMQRASEGDHLSAGMVELLRALRFVHNCEALVEPAFAIWQTVPGNSKAKSLAVHCLEASRRYAVPIVRRAAERSKERTSEVSVLYHHLARSTEAESSPASLPTLPRPAAPFVSPSFWATEVFAELRDATGCPLSASAKSHVGALLSEDDPTKIEALMSVCEGVSLSAFALSIFDAWVNAGAPRRDSWTLRAVGSVGDDTAAIRLGQLIGRWTGEDEYHRSLPVLDALAKIGSRTALCEIQRAATETRYGPVRELALKKLSEAAARLAISQDELADRLIPTFDLDRQSQRRVTFGDRAFVATLNASLQPVLLDDQNRQLSAVPSAAAGEDPAAFAADIARWTSLQTAVKRAATLELSRLDRAMCTQREWSAEGFTEGLLDNPFILPALRGLLWSLAPATGGAALFRIGPDLAFLDVDGAPLAPAARDTIRLVHILSIDDPEIDRWRAVFRDARLSQPFKQLDRETFPADGPELASLEQQIRISTLGVRALARLKRRGWLRGFIGYGGFYNSFSRQLGSTKATITLAIGLRAHNNDPLQQQAFQLVIDRIGTSGMPAIERSELLRDVALVLSDQS